jgi:hypothetical protein
MSYIAIREFIPDEGKDSVPEVRLKRAMNAMAKLWFTC